MAHIPDERFKNTLYDVEDCLDAITDEEVEKPSERKKAIRLFELFLDFCIEERIVDRYDLTNLRWKLGITEPIKGNAAAQRERPVLNGD